jgi:ribosomal protein S18 acetylase RimI-like enzyme
MIEIKPMPHFYAADLSRMGYGYTTTEKYAVHKSETPECIQITLQVVTLEQPYVKRFPESDAEEAAYYERIAAEGLSLGAYDGDELVGMALVERRDWNRTLWIWEFCVDERFRGRSVGRRLMDVLAENARVAGYRAIGLEAQNTNVPAIRFYRAVGFEIDGLDLSYYTNHDVTDGEVAMFMKRKLS